MAKSKLSPIARVNRIIKFYEGRGTNKEMVNSILRKILKEKYK